MAGADLEEGAWGPAPPLTPHFEAQIFSAAATLLRDVGKISAGPPLHKSWIRTCYGYGSELHIVKKDDRWICIMV